MVRLLKAESRIGASDEGARVSVWEDGQSPGTGQSTLHNSVNAA